MKIKNRKDPIPFGPFIILGFLIVVFWGGESLINWYKNTFFHLERYIFKFINIKGGNVFEITITE